jgi:hypothetical protein
MSPAALQLDFVRRRKRLSMLGVAVLCIGAGAAAWTVADYDELGARSAALEASLNRVVSAHRPKPARAVATDARALGDASSAAASLALPWSMLLNDLETVTASAKDDIALLSIEPDPEKHRVRIGAEARSLPAALDFVGRLQSADALRHPLLENHKVRVEQRERPVYFELTAEWSL